MRQYVRPLRAAAQTLVVVVAAVVAVKVFGLPSAHARATVLLQDVAAGRVVSRLWDGLKDVPELCHEAVTHIMHATQSMVVPLGHVRTGMCRHRALFFKYVVDTLPPRSAFPCQLVRGYRNGVPHAWNVVSIPSSASSAAAETLPHHTSCLGGALGDLADDTLLYDERGDGDEATMSAADPPSTVDYVIDSYYCPCTPLRADTPFVRSMYHAMHSISLCASAPAMLRHRVASGDAEPTVGCLLGRGQFSVVRRVSFEGYGAAVKIADAVLVPTLAGYTMAQLLHEPRMYGRVGRDCPFIVDCLGYRVFPPPRHRVHLFLEEMATTVHDVLQKRRVANVPLSDREVRCAVRAAGCAGCVTRVRVARCALHGSTAGNNTCFATPRGVIDGADCVCWLVCGSSHGTHASVWSDAPRHQVGECYGKTSQHK